MSDRAIIYPGQIPLDTDLLNTNKNMMVAVAKLAAGALGIAPIVNGLAVTQSITPNMQVAVAAGEIYALANMDGTSYGSLAADTTHQVMKQGILLDGISLSCPAPGTTGFSINYLIQAAFNEVDVGSVALPYYNASNPSQAWSGPANSGTPQATTRQDQCVVTVKAGTAATTGSQTTPAPDSGNIGLAVVTVAYGAATIVNANISQYIGASLVPQNGLASNVAHAIYSKSVAGAANVTLTAQEAAFPLLTLTGALTGNINVIVPALSRQWIIGNQTSGAFQITVKTAAGTGVVLPQGYTMPVYCDGTNVQSTISAIPSMIPIAQDFRLSLTSAVPVTSADVVAGTNIYCVPYRGQQIGLFNGSTWANYTSGQLSLAIGTLVSGKAYDVFCYQNAGVPTLELGTAWTNDTTRAVALAYQNGILVKLGDSTRRYLGTFYTTGATTTEDSQANRYLWNYYNRVVRKMVRLETVASWTYTTLTWRQANGNTANQLNFILGVAEDEVSAKVAVPASNTSANVGVYVGLAIDNTTAADRLMINIVPAANALVPIVADNEYMPVAGRHYIAWLEQAQAAGTATFYGNAYSSGITGRMMA